MHSSFSNVAEFPAPLPMSNAAFMPLNLAPSGGPTLLLTPTPSLLNALPQFVNGQWQAAPGRPKSSFELLQHLFDSCTESSIVPRAPCALLLAAEALHEQPQTLSLKEVEQQLQARRHKIELGEIQQHAHRQTGSNPQQLSNYWPSHSTAQHASSTWHTAGHAHIQGCMSG